MSAPRRKVWEKDRRQLVVSAGILLFAAIVALLAEPASPADSEDERVPVLLLPGWSDGAQHLDPLRERFLRAGWDSTQVLAVSYADPVGSNVDHADEIAAAVRELQQASGSGRVDVVAHSMSGLATRYWLQRGGAADVRRVVFMATPHRGTLVSYAAWGEGGKEMRPNSSFLLELGGVRGLPDGMEALTIRSRTDMHIIPNSSATLPGVPDVELCCPTHAGLLDSDDAFQAITRFLLRD